MERRRGAFLELGIKILKSLKANIDLTFQDILHLIQRKQRFFFYFLIYHISFLN